MPERVPGNSRKTGPFQSGFKARLGIPEAITRFVIVENVRAMFGRLLFEKNRQSIAVERNFQPAACVLPMMSDSRSSSISTSSQVWSNMSPHFIGVKAEAAAGFDVRNAFQVNPGVERPFGNCEAG